MTVLDQATFLVTLFGMFGTVAATVAALFSTNIAKNSLLEQSENNKRAIKPLLVVRDKNIELEYDPNEPFFY